MGKISFFTITLWLGVLLELLAIGVITHRRLWNKWRSIGAYCASDLAFDVALFLNRPVYKHYFYLYWSSVAISAVLRLWILSDVLESFPGVDFLRRELRWVIAIAGTVMAAGSWYIAFHGTSILVREIPAAVVNLDRCVSIAWGGFYIAALVGIVVFHLAWSRQGASIANALLLTTAADIVVSHLFSASDAGSRATGTYMRSVVALISLFIWLSAMFRPEETYAASHDVLASLGRNSTQLKST